MIFSIWLTGSNFDYSAIYDQLANSSAFIEENYVDPNDVDLIFPENKRNLIYIHVESLEIPLLSYELGGAQSVNLIPEITNLMYENISFTYNGLFTGANPLNMGWTMASLVGQTAGVPLMALAINVQGRNDEFLPNLQSIGRILEDNGYTNTFIMGSEAAFAGRDIYFRTHGNYRILDYNYAIQSGIIPPDYKVWWGFEDEKLYSWAKEEALMLSKEDAPFNLTLLTVDTHHPGGLACRLCIDEHGIQYANAFSCASRQLYNFISWAKLQEFYENTTIIIVGDHPSMDANFYRDLDLGFNRYMPVIIINSAIEPISAENREFSLLDMFPTTLAAMGVDIPGNRLGMGVNLLSDEPTIIEKHSLYTVVMELRKLSRFYNETFW